MKKCFINLYGDCQCLNLYRADISVFREMKKEPNLIRELYEKWSSTDEKRAKKYAPEIIHYFDFKGISNLEKIEILDEDGNIIYSNQLVNSLDANNDSNMGFQIHLNKNNDNDFRELYQLDINKKEYLWGSNQVGLICGSYKGKGVLEFRLNLFDEANGECKIPDLTFRSSFVRFDETRFCDENISRPFINCVSYGSWITQKIKGKYETAYEPLKDFTRTNMELSLVRIAKNKKFGEVIKFSKNNFDFCT